MIERHSPQEPSTQDRPDFDSLKTSISRARDRFSEIEKDVHDIAWVQAKLSLMYEADRHMRNFMGAFYDAGGPRSDSEARELRGFGNLIDQSNIRDLKEILKTYGWVNISTFGAEADHHAFVIVQHADHDRAFQRDVLSRLGELSARQETNPRNYAYLYDRVAEGPQRYGTQGRHNAQGQWEPLPVEAPEHLDARRKAMGP